MIQSDVRFRLQRLLERYSANVKNVAKHEPHQLNHLNSGLAKHPCHKFELASRNSMNISQKIDPPYHV